ncbi:MAG: response regulator transcription factor [Burkholderiales bacterium]|nr:response regulator transcription factor [Burkholderiales bacterium]
MQVLLVDDHAVVWSGIRGVVERLAQLHRPGEPFGWHCASDIAQARELDIDTPDLILLDYHLPGISGIDALHAMRETFEEPPIVVISGDQRSEAIRRTIEAGAAGYIPKAMPEAEMVAALGVVMAHGVYLPPIALLDAEVDATVGDAPLSNGALEAFIAAELSPRQREVFARALRGKPNKVIARELGIAEGTVKVHLAMVYRALGVRNRTEAMYRVLSADALESISRL